MLEQGREEQPIRRDEWTKVEMRRRKDSAVVMVEVEVPLRPAEIAALREAEVHHQALFVARSKVIGLLGDSFVPRNQILLDRRDSLELIARLKSSLTGILEQRSSKLSPDELGHVQGMIQALGELR